MDERRGSWAMFAEGLLNEKEEMFGCKEEEHPVQTTPKYRSKEITKTIIQTLNRKALKKKQH